MRGAEETLQDGKEKDVKNVMSVCGKSEKGGSEVYVEGFRCQGTVRG